MASSIFLIAETPLFVETVERIGKELDCTVHIAHSPAEALLPPTGNIDLIAFEPTKEADKGFALLDILRVRYELPQRKLLIFGGMPEIPDATDIPLPLDAESFSTTMRALLERDAPQSPAKKPEPASKKSAPSSSLGPRFQASKSTVEQAKPLKLTEPLKLNQVVKTTRAPVEKGTQVVKATDVVQEIQQVKEAQSLREVLSGKEVKPRKSTPAKSVHPAKAVQAVKVAGTLKSASPAKPATKAEPLAVPESPAIQATPKPPEKSAAPISKQLVNEPLEVAGEAKEMVHQVVMPEPQEATSAEPQEAAKGVVQEKAQKAAPEVVQHPPQKPKLTKASPAPKAVSPPAAPAENQPTPFESTPSWLRAALGLPATRSQQKEAKHSDPPVESSPPAQAPELSLEPPQKHSPEPPQKHSPEFPQKHSPEHGSASPEAPPTSAEPEARPPLESTPSWLRSALGIESPSGLLPSVEASGAESPSAEHPKPSEELAPDWLSKTLGIDTSDASSESEAPLDLDFLTPETSKPAPSETKPQEPKHSEVVPVVSAEAPTEVQSGKAHHGTEAAHEATTTPAPHKDPSPSRRTQHAKSPEAHPIAPPTIPPVQPAIAPLVIVSAALPAQKEPPTAEASTELPHLEESQRHAAAEATTSPVEAAEMSELSAPVSTEAPPHEPQAKEEPPRVEPVRAKTLARPPAELPVEETRDASRRAAIEAELKATRGLLMEERTTRIRTSKELEKLRTEHAQELEERRAAQELAQAGQLERDAKAAVLLEEQTAKVAELTAREVSLREALAAQENGRNELQASQNKLQASHERELKEARENSERELRELREAQQRTAAELKETQERTLAEHKEAHERMVAELQTNHQRTLSELQENHQRVLGELKKSSERTTSELRAKVETLTEALAAKELALSTETQSLAELKTRVAELTRENEESRGYKEKLEAALAAESLRADEIAGRLAEAESLKARARKLADIPPSGKLSVAELATLASQLVELQATVRLELASPSATRCLWFTSGALSASTSDNEQLITLARRDELIGENQERELAALRMARPSEQREALVARGFLSPEVATALVARWTAHVAEAAFAESATSYRLIEEPAKKRKEPPEFSLPVLPLVRTALRRARHWESALAEFAHAVLLPVERELELSLAGFSAEECALIESAHPNATGEELVAASPLLRGEAYSCLLAAAYLDFVRIESYRDPPPPADPEIGMQRLQAKHDQVQEADYFAILGVPRTAGPDEVRRAYELLSNEFHPLRFSTHTDPAVQERAAAVWSAITEAAEALCDDRLRVEYASHLID